MSRISSSSSGLSITSLLLLKPVLIEQDNVHEPGRLTNTYVSINESNMCSNSNTYALDVRKSIEFYKCLWCLSANQQYVLMWEQTESLCKYFFKQSISIFKCTKRMQATELNMTFRL